MLVEAFEQKHYEAVIAMTRRNMNESFPHLDYNESKARYEADNALRCGGGMAAFIAVHNEEVIGYLMASATEHAFANGKVVSLRLFYVRPESRGTSAAFRLMLAFKEFSRLLGAVETHVGVTSGFHTEQARTFFEKLGYNYVGPLLMMKGTNNEN